MVYQHYKGGIYFLHGTAFAPNDITNSMKAELVATARLTDDITHEVDVVKVTHEPTGMTGFVAYCENLEHDAYSFYEGVDGRFWLREKNEFFGLVNPQNERFKKLSERDAFELLAQMSLRT